jgi:putative N6-adenine-specific DNA methylase
LSLHLVATCALGLEAVVSRELTNLGISDARAENGQVHFQGGPEELCRANMWLRSADRVWLRLGEFPAATFEELFQGTKALPWAEVLPREARFPVDGHVHASLLTSLPAVQRTVKKAVVECLQQRYQTAWLEETGPTFPIRAFLVRDRCALMLDTSGSGLHRRGYHTMNAPAPLRETLAAALVLLSYWRADRPLVDPFCGSGTIPIEAAMIALRRAPGLQRAFAAENWPLVGRKAWQEARREADEAFDRETTLQILGSDVDPEVLALARIHLRQSGLEGRGIHFQRQDIADFHEDREYGVLVTNPPYGERMLERRQAEDLYATLGRVVADLPTWSVYVLSSHPDFARHFRRSISRRRKLYNGMIPCTLHQVLGPPPPREKMGVDGNHENR